MARMVLPPPTGRPATHWRRSAYPPLRHSQAVRGIEQLLDAGDRALARQDFASAMVEYASAALAAYMEREAAADPLARRRFHGLMLFANARLPEGLQQGGTP